MIMQAAGDDLWLHWELVLLTCLTSFAAGTADEFFIIIIVSYFESSDGILSHYVSSDFDLLGLLTVGFKWSKSNISTSIVHLKVMYPYFVRKIE